jgi:hypothetical protein
VGISVTYRSPALKAITNHSYGNAKACPDACRDHLSGGFELLSMHCCNPIRPPGGAIVTAFGGDPFVDMLC